MQTLVQVVRYVSECDVEPVLPEPIPYDQALDVLRALFARTQGDFDLTYADTGRFASWRL